MRQFLPRPKWLANVRAGDVLKTPSGNLRLVRAVHRWRSRWGNDKVACYFAIRHCSWTKRPYTLYFDSDTYLRECHRVAHSRQRLSDLDKRIVQEIEGHHERYADCCEARGLP